MDAEPLPGRLTLVLWPAEPEPDPALLPPLLDELEPSSPGPGPGSVEGHPHSMSGNRRPAHAARTPGRNRSDMDRGWLLCMGHALRARHTHGRFDPRHP